MDYCIITNKKIYQNFKNEYILKNIRLFTEPNFYSIQSYTDSIDLTGIIPYIDFISNIEIEVTSSFIDYINLLLILNFLVMQNYKGSVVLHYINLEAYSYKKSIISTIILLPATYTNASIMIGCIKENKKVQNLIPLIPGSTNFINFYNNLTQKEIFECLIEDLIEESDGDNLLLSQLIFTKYSQFGLSLEFYQKYIKENLV